MNTNFIAVTSRPRKDNAKVLGLTESFFAPPNNLVGSVSKQKASDYCAHLSNLYRAENNHNFVKFCLAANEYIHGHKTVYLVTHKNCEKWMMEGFKLFYKSIMVAMNIINEGKLGVVTDLTTVPVTEECGLGVTNKASHVKLDDRGADLAHGWSWPVTMNV